MTEKVENKSGNTTPSNTDQPKVAVTPEDARKAQEDSVRDAIEQGQDVPVPGDEDESWVDANGGWIVYPDEDGGTVRIPRRDYRG